MAYFSAAGQPYTHVKPNLINQSTILAKVDACVCFQVRVEENVNEKRKPSTNLKTKAPPFSEGEQRTVSETRELMNAKTMSFVRRFFLFEFTSHIHLGSTVRAKKNKNGFKTEHMKV